MKDKIFGVLQRVGRSFMLPLSLIHILIRFSRTVFWPMYRPRPCSALSSNRELHHAGPWPLSLLTVYGEMDAVPPQIEEQPVALEMYIFSPNS